MTPDAFMRRAIRLSRKGFPAPNPHVGCVIVRNGDIVGEGYHHFAGSHHAEVEALLVAGPRAEGATVYVTLEPCNHQGRTGPCSEALIKARVAKVVYATPDPTAHGRGGGRRLQEAGIEVEHGLLAEEARTENAQFFFALEHGRPMVTVKAAMTLDGRIALPSGESQWITGPAARRRAHWLRAQCGAVLVGSGTVKADNPTLTARLPGVVNQPIRVVLDPDGELGGSEAVFNSDARTLRISRTADDDRSRAVPFSDGFDLPALLNLLDREGIAGVLVEGGAHTIQSFIRAGLVDRLEIFIAPKLFGAGISWLEGEVAPTLADAPAFEFDRVRRVGADLWLSAHPKRNVRPN